jgi:small conductance mechanosensitive channel
VFGIGYGDDVDKAKQVLKKLIDGDERILQDPAPFIAVKELGDSSVDLVVRAWAESSDYWGYFLRHARKGI